MTGWGAIPACAVDPADVQARVILLGGRPTISLRRRSDHAHLADYHSVPEVEAAGFDLSCLEVLS